MKTGSPNIDHFHDFIALIEGVSSVKLRPEIGSALILYDPAKLDHDKLLRVLDESGFFNHSQARTPDDYLEECIEMACESATASLKSSCKKHTQPSDTRTFPNRGQ